MKDNILYESLFTEDSKLDEMSNLFPEETGLNYKVWLSTKSGRERHSSRIKISNSDGEVIFSIWGEPKVVGRRGKLLLSGKDFRKIIKFIKLNQETLLLHWEGKTSSKQFTNAIKSI